MRNQGFGSNNYLYANKISPSGQLLWGSGHVHVYDGGSLQFGEFPYFTSDGNGGGVFSWYTNGPTLQSYAQHILSNGAEAFPHNGSPVAVTGSDIRVSPSLSYRPSTQETFVVLDGAELAAERAGYLSAEVQFFAARGNGRDSGKTIVPLGNDAQINPVNVQIGSGMLAAGSINAANGNGTINAIKLDGSGTRCARQFAISNVSRTSRGWPPMWRRPV